MGFLMFCCREKEEDKQREMQSQVVCRGCASVLLYPSGATNVCCALCSTVTSIPSPGTMNAGYFGNLGFVAQC
ncbi:hypothetical protein DKX38_026102 [Salix brachista]|uniref:Zinc finger LSD1-type domain-containing protein n=1 Tax=Salix brachista TaxID=2182728 RepID=A0A5N5JVU8_9ROSI|nr:hypothetical protein DKX38_026102 [Salix brachista]